MVASRKLTLRSLLFFSLYCLSATVISAEVAGDFKKSQTRADAGQDPMTSVTIDSGEDGPQSTLFASCLAASRTLEAKFASIEMASGAEYIRYVPDAKLNWIPWGLVGEDVSDIFECAEAAENGEYPMFKYNGIDCEAVSAKYDLLVPSGCNEAESEAVFVSSSAIVYCPLPTFLALGFVCTRVSEELMTYDEAHDFCDDFEGLIPSYPNFTRIIDILNEHGYVTNLYVGETQTSGIWRGNFPAELWVGSSKPTDPTFEVAYLSYEDGWLLKGAPKSFKAGAVCAPSP